MGISRRKALGLAAAAAGSLAAWANGVQAKTARAARRYRPSAGLKYDDEGNLLYWEKSYSGGPVNVKPLPPGRPGRDYQPVVAPTGYTLPFKIVNGVKVFHLIVEEVEHYFDSGLKATCWAYNNHVNSTVIEAVEGERVRIYVTNRLQVPTSVHWHGMYLPNGMDGVSGLTQPHIKPGETFKYEWTIRQYGTYMYHSHHDTMTQEGMGLIGMFVVHPRQPKPEYHVDRDFVIMLSEWAIEAGASRPNTLEMSDFNILTMNGKCFPSTEPLVCKTGDKVRIRLGNLSQMDHHPIHLHGYHFRITATDGEDIPAVRPVAGDLRAHGRGANAQPRVHRRRPRRLADALPHDAPHHEPDGTRLSEYGGGEAGRHGSAHRLAVARLYDHGARGHGHGQNGGADAHAGKYDSHEEPHGAIWRISDVGRHVHAAQSPGSAQEL